MVNTNSFDREPAWCRPIAGVCSLQGVGMCELDDMDEFAQRRGDVSRRHFGALALGAAITLSDREAFVDKVSGIIISIARIMGICRRRIIGHCGNIDWHDARGDIISPIAFHIRCYCWNSR